MATARMHRRIIIAFAFSSVGWAVVVLGSMMLMVLSSGCASRPLPVRPSIDQLVQESLDSSLPQYEIEQVDHEYFEYEDGAYFGPDDVYDTEGYSLLQPGHPTGRGLTSPIPVDDYYHQDSNEIRFTEEFIETDVREVLLAISEEAQIDLVMDDSVVGVVNTRLEDLPLQRAIEKVLMPLGLHYARRGNQHIVASADPDSPLFSYIAQRVEYRPKHLDAKALIETVPKAEQSFVQLIDGSNMIMIEAPSRVANEIANRFASIDQPVPQVILEAIICVVAPDSGFQFGLDWQHAVELNGDNALKFGATGLALSSTYSQAGANAIFDDFAKTSSFVKLLNEHGYLTIRASPHVMAQDNQQASIAINRETFFSVQPQSGNSTDNNAFFLQQEIQKVESGISLEITPRIRGDVVTIDIEKAEVSEDVRNANTELALNPYPIINRRSVSTTVHVKDGKTIVIGGLVQRETIDRVNRVPGLSKIPLLGYLFETTQRQTRDAEVVIFISPKIVMPGTARE